jgi:hypothetical protein
MAISNHLRGKTGGVKPKRKLPRGYQTVKAHSVELDKKREAEVEAAEALASPENPDIFYEDEDDEEASAEYQADAVIQLGSGDTPLHVDLDKLLKTRLLVVANSGGGKSYLLRQLAEKAARFTPIIVIDVEGEYASLRECPTLRNILLIGELEDRADVQVDVTKASALGAKLVELGQSAVVDISGLSSALQPQYVADFISGMIELPKAKRSNAMVIIDEVHVFAPARGTPPSKMAIADLMSRGRKRGLCGVIATQRIAKADSNTLSEANAVLCGRTRHDNDQERAADLLGLTKGGSKTLSNLSPGEFWAVGAAFAEAFDDKGDEDSYQFKAGKPRSPHPEVGRGKRKRIRSTRPSEKTAERIHIFENLESSVGIDDLDDLSRGELKEMIIGLQNSGGPEHYSGPCLQCGYETYPAEDKFPNYRGGIELPSSDDDEDHDTSLDEEEDTDDAGDDDDDDDGLFLVSKNNPRRASIPVCGTCHQLLMQCTCDSLCSECQEAFDSCVCEDEEEEDAEDDEEEEDEPPCEECNKDIVNCTCTCPDCNLVFLKCECEYGDEEEDEEEEE